ncbi:RDD family protein [Kordiimonas marina]|uniref:RDD family protein n=1 Tax=Kordiimonas marina TaxID=2872312 RepID=UPI001FF68A17|nr:RDD family protein [Kordiimonas marina]MCJ9427538.1 RDD family protein [Kordiimonas marina]
MSRATSVRPDGNAEHQDKIREIITPEGVALKVTLAQRGDRATAVLIDLVLLCIALVAGAISILFLSTLLGISRLGIILVILLIFALRNFYFMFFELKWQGQTPGKRKMGIKVIDRFGKPLTSEAIFARNIMREIELFLPIGVLFSGSATGVTGLMQFFAFVWAATLVCVPMFNRDNLRAGDLVAGTLVVREPKIILAKDMMEAGEAQQAEQGAAYVFTADQLNAYGIFELQTLETLLRNLSSEGAMKRLTAGRAIIKKINWPDPVTDRQMEDFLSCYYHALRKRLEGQLLMGKRKEDKFDTEKADT